MGCYCIDVPVLQRSGQLADCKLQRMMLVNRSCCLRATPEFFPVMLDAPSLAEHMRWSWSQALSILSSPSLFSMTVRRFSLDVDLTSTRSKKNESSWPSTEALMQITKVVDWLLVVDSSTMIPIDLFLYQKSPSFNTGVAFSKRDICVYKSMEWQGIFVSNF